MYIVTVLEIRSILTQIEYKNKLAHQKIFKTSIHFLTIDITKKYIKIQKRVGSTDK